MAKRSDFTRIEKDFYRTIDRRAVMALLPFLAKGTTFAEPCCGSGDLINELERNGILCCASGDIQTGTDAFDWDEDFVEDCDLVITNFPWSRTLLHPMIKHFAKLRPTWSLHDSSWAYTKQSSDIVSDLCTDIVAVGRLIWIPDTKMQGKDDCSWYRFDVNKDKERGTVFHGRN